MKKKIQMLAMAALAACASAAMPTEAEMSKASKEVQEALKAKIAAWQKGDLSDSDLAALMFMNADKFKDEARHYACLQAAFAAAARADDAAFAAKALSRIFMETKDFTPALEEKLIDRTLAKMGAKEAASFRKRLEEERAKNVFESSVLVAGKLDKIVLPSVSFKPPATLFDAVEHLRELSWKYDPSKNNKGIAFILTGVTNPPKMPKIVTNNIKLRDLLKLVVDSVGYAYAIEGDVVRIYKK